MPDCTTDFFSKWLESKHTSPISKFKFPPGNAVTDVIL